MCSSRRAAYWFCAIHFSAYNYHLQIYTDPIYFPSFAYSIPSTVKRMTKLQARDQYRLQIKCFLPWSIRTTGMLLVQTSRALLVMLWLTLLISRSFHVAKFRTSGYPSLPPTYAYRIGKHNVVKKSLQHKFALNLTEPWRCRHFTMVDDLR